ncbi:unnamed protein product, partial [Prorocentrum cordatum]
PLGREVPVPAQTGGHLRAAVPGPRHGRVRSGQPRQRGHRGAGPEGHRARAQAEPGRVQQLPGGGGQHHLRSQPHPPAAEAVIGQARELLGALPALQPVAAARAGPGSQ